jgi:hypothetical protein
MNLKALQDCVIMERDVEKHAFLELPQTTKLGTGVYYPLALTAQK